MLVQLSKAKELLPFLFFFSWGKKGGTSIRPMNLARNMIISMYEEVRNLFGFSQQLMTKIMCDMLIHYGYLLWKKNPTSRVLISCCIANNCKYYFNSFKLRVRLIKLKFEIWNLKFKSIKLLNYYQMHWIILWDGNEITFTQEWIISNAQIMVKMANLMVLKD